VKYGTAAVLFLLVCASQAQARMYQWISPETGSIQLSGSPPAWYRSGDDGPRIFVFENGRLVDDTAVSVADFQREQLRVDAFIEEEALVRGASAKQLESLTRALEDAADEGIDVSAVTKAFAAERQAAESNAKDASEPGPVADTVAQLKALLDAWDRTRLGEAKSLLERAGSAMEATSGPAP
jgi:hypothetical protein